MDDINIYPNKKRLVSLTFLCVLMTLAGILIMFYCTNNEISFSLAGALGGLSGYTIAVSMSYYKTNKSSDKAKKFVSIKKQIKYIVIFALIMGSGLVINDGIYFFMSGFIATLFFGFCTYYYIYRIFRNIPSLEITSRGIFDNSTMTGKGQVYWNEIKDVFTYEYMNNRMLAIIPYDMKDIKNRQSKLKKIFIGEEKLINIPQNTLSMSVEELEEEIRIRINNNEQ